MPFVYPSLSDRQYGYIAGLIDGEGCITISRETTSNRPRAILHRPVVSISNTNKDALLYIRQIVGGGIITTDARRGTKIRKPCFRLVLPTTIIRWLLPNIIDDIHIKTKQSKILLDFLLTTGLKGGMRLPQKTYDIREQLCKQIKGINKRGVT